jgi:uncharacterized protein (TIGR03382 family)
MPRLALVLALVLVPLFARADVPPEPGYVEQCTVELQQKAGETCLACSGSYHGDTEVCAREHAPNGYARRCQTRGASVWGEVWCKAGQASASTDPTVPAQPAPQARKGGCQTGPGGLAGWGLVLAAMWLVRRRPVSR